LNKHPKDIGFIAATASVIAIFAAGASPIALYSSYRRFNGITFIDLSFTAVGYFAGALTALVVLGRLSNYLGRRFVSLLALGLAATACLILLDVTSATPLIIGRILQGLACGLGSSAIASFIVDNAPQSPPWLAAATVSGAPMLGLTAGAVSAGLLVEYGPAPRVLPYLVVVAALCVCAVLIALSRETVVRRPGVLASFRPQFMLPQRARRLFPVAVCTFVCTWSFGGFYQGFGPSMATDLLGSNNALVAAMVFASMMAPSVFGAALSGRLLPASAQRFGMVVFFLAVTGVLLSLKAKMVVPFLMASAFAGVAQGVTLAGSIRALLAGAVAEERAGVLSVIYATCYASAAIPSLIVGQLSRSLNLLQIAAGYGMLAALGCVFTLLAARNPMLDQSGR
jgi:MFS family permease